MIIEFIDKREKKVFSDGVENIATEISDSTIKVVSFDIFDTLLLRPVLEPADTFRLLENKLNIPNFHNMRTTAEAEARKHKSVYVQDITLNDIYDMYEKLFNVTKEEKERLLQEELKLEYTILYERKSAKYLYEKARAEEKRIIIISDMYLSKEFLDKVLKKNGYDGYSNLYVSSETGVLKGTRMMYQVVLSELALQGIKPEEILHIGDNKRADVECALVSGMRAAHLPRPADRRNNCRQLRRVYEFILQDSLNSNNAMLYGIMLNLYFDDPFVEFHRSTYFNGDPKLMGYWFAPLMIGFTKWMIEQVEKYRIDQILWVWRDGYLPYILFHAMRAYFTERNIESKKLYMGRDLRMPFSALDRNGFFQSFADNPLHENCTVDYFIRNRVLCKDDMSQYQEILNIFLENGYLNEKSEIGKFERYRGFLNTLEPYFLKNAGKLIELYGKYIGFTVDRDKKNAIFDRSPRGKSSRFLEQYFSIESVCFTTEVYDTKKAKLNDVNTHVESYLEYGRFYINRMGCIWAQLFEIIISDRAQGFKNIIDNHDGTYSVELNDFVQNEMISNTDSIVKKIQDAIVEFVNVTTKSLGDYLPYIELDRYGLFDYAVEPLNTPHIEDAGLITQIYPGTSILAPIAENVFVDWYSRKVEKADQKEYAQKKLWDYIRHAGYVTAEKLGILWPARTLYRKIIGDPLEPIVSLEKIQRITNSQIDYIRNLNFGKINVAFMGSIPQDVGSYFNKLAKINSSLYFVFIAVGFMKIPDWLEFPCIAGPQIFSFWGLEGQDLKIKLSEEIKNRVYGEEYLYDLAKRRILRGYSKSVAIALAYEAERYFEVLIEKINPRLLIVWNNWGNNSVVPCEIAKKRGIPVISAERGFLEGTMMFSKNGYGKDLINTNPEKFCVLPVRSSEIKEAKEVIKFLKDSRFNRYIQPVSSSLEQLRQKMNNGKHNILFTGSFDCENPIFPQNDEVKMLYSPFFETSEKAFEFIKKLARKNDWNLIYKPHPLMDQVDQSKNRYNESSHVHIIKEIDINDLIDFADVVICMVSGVSYISLIRGKPLVELAYTPLKSKGCCYEPDSEADIEFKIKKALKDGYTTEQEKAFIRHVAQVNKYYYFDDLGSRAIRYGRSIEEISTILNTMIN